MKRTGFGPRKTPMSRGSWKSSPTDTKDWRAELRANPKRSTLKSKSKRPTVAEGSKYLEACRGEDCYLRIRGVCCGWSETVVPAHSNQAKHGKSMGRKADHIFTVPACLLCHTWIDQGSAERERKFAEWDSAYAEWVPVRARKMNLELEEA